MLNHLIHPVELMDQFRAWLNSRALGIFPGIFRPATGQVLPPNTADLVTQSMRCVPWSFFNQSWGQKIGLQQTFLQKCPFFASRYSLANRFCLVGILCSHSSRFFWSFPSWITIRVPSCRQTVRWLDQDPWTFGWSLFGKHGPKSSLLLPYCFFSCLNISLCFHFHPPKEISKKYLYLYNSSF